VEAVAVPDPGRREIYNKILPLFRRCGETQSELGDQLARLDL
jgi:hypothetical protein